jgi:membrane protease subunit HflK
MKLLEPAVSTHRARPEGRLRRWSSRRGVALAAVAAWLATGVYIVGADQQAVVTRFGKVVEPRAMPGIHYSLPWPVDRVTKLKVRQLQRLIIGGEVGDAALGRSDPLASQFLTGDQNLIHMRVAVQYSVGVPADYLFRAQDTARLVGAAVEAELAHQVAARDVDAVLTTDKAAIQEQVRAAAQRLLDAYGIGVVLAGVNIESVAPPAEAADAFREVAGARADAARIVNEAEGYAGDVVPRARGQAHEMLEAAQAYKLRRINQAMGEAARFAEITREYDRAGAVHSHRLYVEAMEQILPKIRKLIVDKRGELDLTIIRKGAAAAPVER